MIRSAEENDANVIMSILEECRDEIPLKPDLFTQRRQKMQEKIQEFCKSNKSIVSVDSYNQVVGFALVTSQIEDDGERLKLEYIAVKKINRDAGIFSEMMKKIQSHNLSIQATVNKNNKSSMEERLIKNGFLKELSYHEQSDFVWMIN
jgi:N-acetylglutamate synthase-like GNAT family acetyltransferase